jgi:hypothetical protein
MLRHIFVFVVITSSFFAANWDEFSQKEWTRYASSNVENKLSRPQFDSILYYINHDHFAINQCLRGTSECDSDTTNRIKNMESSLKLLPKYKEQSFRGASFEYNNELFKKYTTVGNEVSDPAFLSSSTDRYVAESFIMEGGTENLILCIIQGNSGRDLVDFNSGWEREVLFPPGTKFRITNVYQERVTNEDGDLDNDLVNIVEMTETSAPYKPSKRIFNLLYKY